jgi:hypothetical protein
MRRHIKQLDMVFVLDATNSSEYIFSAMYEQAMDTAFQIHTFSRQVDGHYGVVIYRDPVDHPDDPENINDFRQLTDDREILSDYFNAVKVHGGQDDSEDWVGAFELALHRIQWREGSEKCLFWMAGANAHGSEYSFDCCDRYNEEASKLTRLIQEAAERRFYFIGINVKKNGEPGCEKILQKLRGIYEKAGVAHRVAVKDYQFYWDQDHNQWQEDELSRDVLAILDEVLVRPCP